MSISQPLPHDTAAPSPVGECDNEGQGSVEIAVGSLTGSGGVSRQGPGVWHFLDLAVPATARGRWCIISCDFRLGRSARIRIEFFNVAGARVTWLPCSLANTVGQTSYGVCCVPADAEHARLELWGPRPAHNRLAITYRPIGRVQAAARIALAHPVMLGKQALWIGSQLHRRHSVSELFRGAVKQVLESGACKDYMLWSSLFDSWDLEALQESLPGPMLGLLVFDTGNNKQALSATLRSLAAQRGAGLPHAIVGGAAKVGLDAALSNLPAGCDYVGILQAGEMLGPHAALLARAQLDTLGMPALVYADEDVRPEPGSRYRGAPLFKPEPNRMLMMSGTLSRGLWLVRRGLLAVLRELGDETADWAEAVRLSLWLHLHEAGVTRSAGTRRVPFVLTHRRPDTEGAPHKLLSRIVEAHLGRTAMPLQVASEWPMRLHAVPLQRDGRVSIVVLSALRSPEVEHCIRAVLSGTRHDDLEMIIGVSQPGPLNPAQRAMAARIGADHRAKVVPLRADHFNFSWTNNQCAKLASGEQILLLNDDVFPMRPDWLRIMLAHLADPAVGVVGAKLLYPHGTVQHGGVIMGLDGLCNHAFRTLAGDEPGYAARAVLPQELSAVTGACLLIRRPLLEKLGGFDESYFSAFNDVDLCLRVREEGYAVVFAPEAVLYHLESHTYGSHHAGERAVFREAEIERLRARWARVIEEDPFHSPNLCLVAGREWEPAFPPRAIL
jgi:O-antigen biosynthesis protein